VRRRKQFPNQAVLNMAKQRRQPLRLDLSAIVETMGMAWIVKQLGVKQIVEYLGAKQVIQLAIKAAGGVEQFVAALTPAQRRKLKQLLQKRMAARGGHRSRGLVSLFPLSGERQ
jgi:hypothetical protein